MNKKLLVIGGSSEIIRETLRCFYNDGYEIHLTCRNRESIQLTESITGAFLPNAKFYKLDLESENYNSQFSSLIQLIQPDVLIIASGYLPLTQQLTEIDKTLKINFISVAHILNSAALYFEDKKQGAIIVLSSVAGDRGRYSNFVYGSAKAGLTTFLSGLRARLYSSNVKVITVKCGIVDTRMTRGTGKVSRLAASKEKVGKAIFCALKKKKDVVYIPSYWRLVMLVIKLLPESIFKRMKF